MPPSPSSTTSTPLPESSRSRATKDARGAARLLRRIRPNLDVLWAGAFVVTGAFALATV